MVPRLRMFAGPNGSGKTTLKGKLLNEFGPGFIGIDINPDDIEEVIRDSGSLDFETFGLRVESVDVIQYIKSSTLLAAKSLSSEAAKLSWSGGRLDFSDVAVNSYFASVCAAFIREQLVREARSFSLETVMSSPDKPQLLRTAQESGYRTYLYFVATSDPEQSVARVEHRVAMGGHAVPREKIRSRYTRCMNLLATAIRWAHRAYLFDNSGSRPELIGEVTDGTKINLHTTVARDWFQRHVLDQIPGAP